MSSNSTVDEQIPRSALVAELSALTRAGREDSDRWSVLQDELTRRRVAEARAKQLDVPPPPPSIRAGIIAALRDAPGSTPSQLAQSLGKSTTVVSRVLAGLLEGGVVSFSGTTDDRRIRHYALVEAAGTTDGFPSATDVEIVREHIALAIGVAVEARRKRNELEYARDRLERLLNQATRIGADDLALLARTELITTLRQESQTTPASEAARAEHLKSMGSMLSVGSSFPTHLVAPAIGSLEYELGRDKSKPMPVRLRHLTAAEVAFGRCEDLDRSQDWGPREGWALLMRGDLWRKQTEFGKAQSLALQASTVFDAYDDRYGAAESFRLLGFCQRLRGDFGGAVATLQHALAIEGDAVSDRCRADVMLQLGDAFRCIGHLDRASYFLDEAERLASSLGRIVTLGFVQTSLAAVHFANEDMDLARATARRAQKSLIEVPAGKAMNDRRLAVICRELALGGDASEAENSATLFRESLAGYQDLGSPAGVAACLVGAGRLPGQNEDTAVASLKDLASSSTGRMLLPKDPWLPALVTQWAKDTARGEVQEVIDWTFKDNLTNQVAPEMAAEPRILSMVDAA